MYEKLSDADAYRNAVEYAAEEVYRFVATTRYAGCEMHASPNCEPITRHLGKLLLAYGLPASRRYVAPPPSATWRYHYLLHDADRNLFIDPTWQQFLPAPAPEVPKVLIATEAEMRLVCDELMIDANYRAIWSEDPAERPAMWPTK